MSNLTVVTEILPLYLNKLRPIMDAVSPVVGHDGPHISCRNSDEHVRMTPYKQSILVVYA